MLGLGLGLNRTVGKVRPKNEVAYNPETWAEWTSLKGVTFDVTGASMYGTSSSGWPQIKRSTSIKTSTKYGVLLSVLSNTWTEALVMNTNITGFYKLIAAAGTTGNIKEIFTSQATISENNFSFMPWSALEEGELIKIKDIRVFELPVGSQIESDFENLTADQLNEKYPF